MRNQIVKYYLRKWGYFDKNVHYLNKVDSVKMKTLYSALMELSADERFFLAEKYRVGEKQFIPDSILAAQHEMDLKGYRVKRIALENKLNPVLKKHIDLYKNELKVAIKLDYQRK